MAIRMAQAVRLDCDPDDEPLQTEMPGLSWIEKETRRRTWWMCVIIDRVSSTLHGTPMILSTSLENVRIPTADDMWEERMSTSSDSSMSTSSPFFSGSTPFRPGLPAPALISTSGDSLSQKRPSVGSVAAYFQSAPLKTASAFDHMVVFSKMYYDVNEYQRKAMAWMVKRYPSESNSSIEIPEIYDLARFNKLETDLKSWYTSFGLMEEEERLLEMIQSMSITGQTTAGPDHTPMAASQQEHDPQTQFTREGDLFNSSHSSGSVSRKSGLFFLYHTCRIVLHRCNMLLAMKHQPLLAAMDVEEFTRMYRKEREAKKARAKASTKSHPSSSGFSSSMFSSDDGDVLLRYQSLNVHHYYGFRNMYGTYQTPQQRLTMTILRSSIITTVHATERIMEVISWMAQMQKKLGQKNAAGSAGSTSSPTAPSSSSPGASFQNNTFAGVEFNILRSMGLGLGFGGVDSNSQTVGPAGGLGLQGDLPGAFNSAALLLSPFPGFTFFDAAVSELSILVLMKARARYLKRQIRLQQQQGEGASSMEDGENGVGYGERWMNSGEGARDAGLEARSTQAVSRIQNARAKIQDTILILGNISKFWKVASNLTDAIRKLGDEIKAFEDEGESGSGDEMSGMESSRVENSEGRWDEVDVESIQVPEVDKIVRFLKTFRRRIAEQRGSTTSSSVSSTSASASTAATPSTTSSVFPPQPVFPTHPSDSPNTAWTSLSSTVPTVPIATSSIASTFTTPAMSSALNEYPFHHSPSSSSENSSTSASVMNGLSSSMAAPPSGSSPALSSSESTPSVPSSSPGSLYAAPFPAHSNTGQQQTEVMIGSEFDTALVDLLFSSPPVPGSSTPDMVDSGLESMSSPMLLDERRGSVGGKSDISPMMTGETVRAMDETSPYLDFSLFMPLRNDVDTG
ncbi:hypothetical protein HK102_004172 [Quaeritorhiza haematococci]|nr:hypothetical protein HK102_004172 [Quaeritorhiza haematococci]